MNCFKQCESYDFIKVFPERSIAFLRSHIIPCSKCMAGIKANSNPIFVMRCFIYRCKFFKLRAEITSLASHCFKKDLCLSGDGCQYEVKLLCDLRERYFWR